MLRGADRQVRDALNDRRELRLAEAATRRLQAAADPDAGHTDRAWDVAAGRTSERGLTKQDEARVRERAIAMRMSNPLAARYTRLMRQMTAGVYAPIATNEEVQAVLDAFWESSYNDWPSAIHAYGEIFGTAGRLALPVQVYPESGFCQIGYMDPADASHVVSAPGNSRDPSRDHCREGVRPGRRGTSSSERPRTRRIRTPRKTAG